MRHIHSLRLTVNRNVPLTCKKIQTIRLYNYCVIQTYKLQETNRFGKGPYVSSAQQPVRDFRWRIIMSWNEFVSYHFGTGLDVIRRQKSFQTCLSSLVSIGSYFKPECLPASKEFSKIRHVPKTILVYGPRKD